MQNLNKSLRSRIISYISNHRPTFDYNYNDEFRKEQIKKIIESKDGYYSVINEIEECNFDYSYDLQIELCNQIIEAFKLQSWEPENLREEFLDYLSVDLNIEQLANNTSAHFLINLYSNYDCINSFWHEFQEPVKYEPSYLKDTIDALKLNPQKVKRILNKNGIGTIGRWPNFKVREGQEVVSYDHFFMELENMTCGANLAAFAIKVPLTDIISLYQSDKNIDQLKIIIPINTPFGFFSSFYGGGSSFDATTKNELTLQLRKPLRRNESYYHWDIIDATFMKDQVYGLSSDFYNPVIIAQ